MGNFWIVPLLHSVSDIAFCGLSDSTTFFVHYLIIGTIFGKELLSRKCVLWFCLQFLSEIFHILRRIQGDTFIYVHGVLISP